MDLGRLDHLTFKGNLRNTRYGWIRLTPAFSVHLVSDILTTRIAKGDTALDPFCGTGTTALVCAEHGIHCDTTDINPFLIWLAKAKTRNYTTRQIESFADVAARVSKTILSASDAPTWAPPLFQIEKWWGERTTRALGRAIGFIKKCEPKEDEHVVDLLKVAFCRTMIQRANVSFGHQSMSFKKADDSSKIKNASLMLPYARSEEDTVDETWKESVSLISGGAQSTIRDVPRVVLCDARDLRSSLPLNNYSCVITSPPYPNRMSYIRELRPYMYWLGYLTDAREAGELDWKAIGGTWGCATSNVSKWRPDTDSTVPFHGLDSILSKIADKSAVLSRYVQKYFHDMVLHCESVFDVVKPGGSVHYIVGNSKFYDVMLPVEEIYAELFRAAGFSDVGFKVIRKRTSKKELFEFVVSGEKPAASASKTKPARECGEHLGHEAVVSFRG